MKKKMSKTACHAGKDHAKSMPAAHKLMHGMEKAKPMMKMVSPKIRKLAASRGK